MLNNDSWIDQKKFLSHGRTGFLKKKAKPNNTEMRREL